MAVELFDLSSSIRRYHIYQQLWNPQPGKLSTAEEKEITVKIFMTLL